MIEIHQFMCLSDNFGVLVHDGRNGATTAIEKVDPDLTLWGLRLIYRRNRNR